MGMRLIPSFEDITLPSPLSPQPATPSPRTLDLESAPTPSTPRNCAVNSMQRRNSSLKSWQRFAARYPRMAPVVAEVQMRIAPVRVRVANRSLRCAVRCLCSRAPASRAAREPAGGRCQPAFCPSFTLSPPRSHSLRRLSRLPLACGGHQPAQPVRQGVGRPDPARYALHRRRDAV